MKMTRYNEDGAEASLEGAVSRTERAGVFIKTVSAEDTQRLLEIYKPYVEETAITFEYQVPSLEEFQERVRRIQKRYPYLAAWKTGLCLSF